MVNQFISWQTRVQTLLYISIAKKKGCRWNFGKRKTVIVFKSKAPSWVSVMVSNSVITHIWHTWTSHDRYTQKHSPDASWPRRACFLSFKNVKFKHLAAHDAIQPRVALPPCVTTCDALLLEKKLHTFINWWKRQTECMQIFFCLVILTIFEFSFILDHSQVCISIRLEVRACQSELFFF